ncbi:hypothetical protein L1987_21593 [Smallanthus sonchifolius]|uniref:Uncharacterized protein n=1 Tax=Smallanthus sonchifolius TaxID=185202 RepID=A0ACB9IWP2_9ASTR|nr:hypothetical protein L1987_21593 [Smallanthus sonchifolius]
MTGEEDGPPPPSPKKFKMETEELLKDEDHSEEESKEIEDDDEEDGPPSSPPLLDMIDFPPPSTLPPLSSSPRDFDMEQQDSDEDDGPPSGWNNKYQLKEQQAEQIVTLAATSTISADIQAEDVRQDAHYEEGEPRSQAHPSLPPEVAPSDMQTQDALQDAQNEEGQPTPEVPSDLLVDQEDSGDEGPPPGWDSKCQSEPEVQELPQSDIRVVEQDSEDDGPPPGWDLKCQLEPNLQITFPTTPPSGAGTGHEPNNLKVIEESPQPPSRQQSIIPAKPQISVPKPATNNPEMGQMVCGSCRHLLSYPREHEVGQVVCGGCNVLLMYPHGAPKVRCANCRMETEIGDQNRRPPLSEHKRRARQHLKRVQAA